MPGASEVPYATDGTDFRGAVKYHYTIALKRFARYSAVFAPMWILVLVTRIEYLLPLAIVGFIGLLFTAILFYWRMLWIRKCSRVFRMYPLEFRSPLEKVHQEGPLGLFLRLGQRGDSSATMRAKDPLGRAGWPGGIADGVWFAGDDAFGGAAIVPGTGELLFMQPKEWELKAEEREIASAERTKKASRAGIKRRINFR